MNCFVIMPYASEFEDVHAAIVSAVKDAFDGQPVRCFRLDENRPAGRITERLIEELRGASLCVADVTGGRPNVMWEVGYVMALGKPTIFLTQDAGPLPFDVHDVQSIAYDRHRLTSTLARPLERSVRDTLKMVAQAPPPDVGEAQDLRIGELHEQIRELKEMVSQAVRLWEPVRQGPRLAEADPAGLRRLEGAWVSPIDDTHFYARMIGGEFLVAYCYTGDLSLTGVYTGWKRSGDYWFARFRWTTGEVSGFTFLKQESDDRLQGAWWLDEEVLEIREHPEMQSGVPSAWVRNNPARTPDWALRFFDVVERNGLATCLRQSEP